MISIVASQIGMSEDFLLLLPSVKCHTCLFDNCKMNKNKGDCADFFNMFLFTFLMKLKGMKT